MKTNLKPNKIEDPETITKIIKATFETPQGINLLEHLLSVFVDRAVYKPGLSSEETAYREGQRDVVRQIIKEFQKGL